LELGLGGLDAAQARLQAVRRLLPASMPEAQETGPLFCGLAEVALWRGHLEQARELVAEGVPLVATNPRHAAPLYALGLRVEADRAELARARHPGEAAPDDAAATALLDRLDQATTGPAGASIPALAAWQALGLAERTRQQGPSDPTAWAAAAAAWERLGQPYRAAYAGFRQAEALLATTGDPVPAPPPPCGAPPPSPAAWAPARSTPRSRPWRGAPAWTSAPPPQPLARRRPRSSWA
jgi:hypothetical protein